jgi:hypothetical protein
MRDLFLGATTALALGVLTLPNVAIAGHHSGAGHYSGGSFNAGKMATGNIGNRPFVNSNVIINHNVNRNFVVNPRFNNRFALNDRHHHHHHHRFFFPGFVYDDSYASYDTCYQYVWTPYGYRYVNVCVSDYYDGNY